MDPVSAVERAAFLLERSGDRPRARAFRRAAATMRALDPGELSVHLDDGTLQSLPGVGPATARIAAEVRAGGQPSYLRRLEEEASRDRPTAAGDDLWRALRGDCHVHSDWSDGGASIEQMAMTARALGREYIVLTDHSPRLRIAGGLSAERLREQLRVVHALNRSLAPFTILTGIEVDILEDGELDQDPELLASLDVVVGSVHSRLGMDGETMTRRLLRALAHPHLDILGHVTGRMRRRRGDRPESSFDAASLFAAAARADRAIEINSQLARRDPPRRLIRAALEAGCRFAIDSDAHAPGELAWTAYGCDRAAAEGVTADRVVNALSADELRAWTRTHDRDPSAASRCG